MLLGDAIGVGRTVILAHPDAPVGADAAAKYRAALERRAAGEPVAYIRGLKEFFGLAFEVDRRALIPRPETERLVELALAEIMRRLAAVGRGPGTGRPPPGRRRRDGSGAVAVALAVELQTTGGRGVDIVAIDVSPDALDLARENAVGHAVADHVSFALGDLLPDASLIVGPPYDVVVANLPYVRDDAMAELPVATTFEPALALDGGGADGTAVIERLLGLLPEALLEGGIATLEIGADQGESIVAVVARVLPGWSCVVEPDLAGLPRVALVTPG